MAGMGETCNHITVAVQISLTSPACTSNANEWISNQKTVKPKKIKDLDFGRNDFGQRGKKGDH